ncbi:MAG TPA: Hsp20/alpha crystallin family protein [Woeseiaceae bacterium]|nr:Hsp20/alpha crystallin family protein [Woeseiaceae bacterium]
MNLTRWAPLRDMDDFFADYRSLFNRPAAAGNLPQMTDSELRWRPVADISENDKEFVVKAELPEVRREDVSVTVEDGVLKIEGTRKYEKESKDEKQHRTESFYGSFFRAFSLPDNVDDRAIRAECKDGILKVHLPKTENRQSGAKKIDVK